MSRALAFGLATVAFAATLVMLTMNRMESPKVGQEQSELNTIKSLVNQFRRDCGRCPTTSEGLSALLTCPPSLQSKWRGPYATVKDDRFSDPWGHPYLYGSHADFFALFCFGADGRAGGKGRDSDLVVID